MRRTIRILTYIGLAIATAAFIVLFASSIPIPQSNTAVALTKLFNDFPANEPQFIDLRLDELSFGQLTDREKQDQLRDWLLFTIASDKDLSAKEINESLYDLSTTRQGYMRPVSNFEYGTTRSLYVGDGEVVALIPTKLTAPERADALAHIADKHRKDLGKKPTGLLVFEYELNLPEQYAVLTRRESLDANKFFTAPEGYIESKVSTLNDLESFVNTVDDLTYTQLAGDQLLLGGRKIQGRTYEGIQIEDIAAIWQSEEKIRSDLAAFESRWNARINSAPASQQSQLEKQAHAEFAELGLVKGSGFSLDWDYDYKKMLQTLEAAESGLQKLGFNSQLGVSSKAIQDAKTGLQQERVQSYDKLADSVINLIDWANSQNHVPPDLSQQEINAVEQLALGSFKYGYQYARYDGNLRGTEVSMTLFYTDLLAKLWGFNRADSGPQEHIEGFVPWTQIKIPSIYKDELKELPYTRLWFEPNSKGFQISDNGNTLLFTRNSTQVAARSSTSGQADKEVAATYIDTTFLDWWNGHYEEVAEYEPEYQRLNEIMKWSLIISWLHNQEQDNLKFLGDIEVHRGYWFPDWVAENEDRLKFKAWDQVTFFKRGFQGKDVETLPLLESEKLNNYQPSNQIFYGGVSLADEGLFQGRKALSSVDNLDTIAYRSNIDYGTLQTNGDQLNFTTLEGTAYRLFNEQPTLASVAARAKEGNKLRGRVSELANLEFTKNVERTSDGLSVSTLVDGTELGRLKTNRTGNGFTVGWLGRDIDEGQLLVQQIKQAANQPIDMILRDHPLVVAVVQSDDGSRYTIKLQGSEDWVEIAAGGGGSDLPPDWQARVGSFPDDPGDTGDILLRWVDDEQVQKQLSENTAKLIIDNQPDAAKGLNPDELIQSLQQHNYEQVAQQIAADPKAAHRIAREHMQAELKVIDDLRQQKQTARALQRLDELIVLYGRQPDLMVYKALLDIDRPRLSVRRIDPNGKGSTSVSGQEDFYAAVNQILDSSDDSPHFKAIVTDNEVIYIQDSPSFNNIDPSTPIGDAFPFGSEARAYRVESGNIADAHIGSSGYDDPVAALLVGSGDSSSPNTFNLDNFARTVHSSADDDTCEEAEPAERDSHCRQVYVVIDETTL